MQLTTTIVGPLCITIIRHLDVTAALATAAAAAAAAAGIAFISILNVAFCPAGKHDSCVMFDPRSQICPI